MNKEELNKILDNHKKWLNYEDGGERADLSKADLRWANLGEANLSGAILFRADLHWANLRWADLSNADLSKANLCRANLSEANLRWANFSEADLRWANFSEADLSKANLRGAIYDYSTIGINLACPEEGEFIAWKQARKCIIKLQVPDDAKRSSATTRKIRVSKAKVLSIINEYGKNIDFIRSNYDSSFVYTVGETIEVPDFDDSRWNECSLGIHCFLTRHEAEMRR